MVRILYGLCSVGVGHAIRAKVVLEHLCKSHEVMVITSNKAYTILNKDFKNVHNIAGFELVFKENKILNAKTLLRNIGKLGPNNLGKLKLIRSKIKKFNPDIVISDWETFSSFIAKEMRKPLISFDNQHYLVYGKFKVPDKYFSDFFKARVFLYSLVAKAKYHVISYFGNTQVKRKKSVFLVPPVIRSSVLKSKVSSKENILVYQSTESYKKLLNVLKKINCNFTVYGYNVAKKDGNLTFKRFDEVGFVKDLAKCKAVICNGGFTLISEALYLGKPLLVLPIKGHFEQILNGLYVRNRRYGMFSEKLNSNIIEIFLDKLDNYRREKRKHYNNKKLFWILDQIIKRELK